MKKIFEKKLTKKNIFRKKILQNIFQQKFAKKISEKILRNFILPTLVEVSLSGLKLEKNEIFLLQWIEVG